jgi:anti-anti-sigma factor
MEDAFSISTLACEGMRIVVVNGELDELTTPELEELIDGSSVETPVIIDLSGVAFVSSAGIQALLREREATTALVCPPGNVMRLFEIVRTNRRVPIYENMDAALASLALVCSA